MGRKNKRRGVLRNYRALRGMREMFLHPESVPDIYRSRYIATAATDAATAAAAEISNHTATTIAADIHRGDIFFADLGTHCGTSVQSGCRPVLIISNDKGNEHSETVTVIPMTGSFKRTDLPCHTVLNPQRVNDKQRPLSKTTVLAEQITTLSKSALKSYIGRIDDQNVMEEIENTLFVHLGLTGFAPDNFDCSEKPLME